MIKQNNDKDWYGNKEIYEMFLGLKKEFLELKAELSLTRQFIRQYNKLQEKLNECKYQIDELQRTDRYGAGVKKGRKDASTTFRRWGGWIVAIITSIIAGLYHLGLF